MCVKSRLERERDETRSEIRRIFVCGTDRQTNRSEELAEDCGVRANAHDMTLRKLTTTR